VPLFGSNRLNRRSAAEAVVAERAAATLAHYELFGAAWDVYAEAFHSGELARHAAEHRSLMDRLVESARARYESGRGRLEDVLRAEAERARVLADLAAYRAEERSALARLAALRGVEPTGAPDSLAPPPEPIVPAEAAGWLVAVEPGHARLRETEARTSRYRFAARAARRMAWPDLELRGSYGRRGPLEGGIELDGMYSVTVGFMLPIFARSRELSEAAEMDAMARAAESERRAAELELRQQVSALHASAAAARRAVSLLADTVVVTQRRAVDASWSAYAAGSTDLWRVFEAAHALYNEEVALTRARLQLARAQAQMLSITGRGDLLGIALPPVAEESR
jgi:outer membrane protein TolC